MKCDLHPKYKAVRKPKPGCVICHAMWQETLVERERGIPLEPSDEDYHGPMEDWLREEYCGDSE
jgi:hypothetical protein